MTPETLVLRVQRVRTRLTRATVISGLAIKDGCVIADAPRYAVTLPDKLLTAQVERGQWWCVTGCPKPVQYEVDGYRMVEHRFVASAADLLRPSGEHIVQLLSTSPAFPGIGEVKARRLWEDLGEELYDSLDNADHETLSTLVGYELADVLINGWREYENADVLRWFQRVGLDLRLSRKLLAAYGGKVLEALEIDPYRLLSFGMAWEAVENLAQRHFGLNLDDERRLSAAVEAVLYQAFDAGDTCSEQVQVKAALVKLIGSSQVDAALSFAESNHLVSLSGSRLQALGPHVMERSVAAALRQRMCATPLASRDEVESLIEEFEREQAESQHEHTKFALNEAQRGAVHAAAQRPLLLITGGAGVGKTTVLKAVGRLLECYVSRIYFMALSGRAAKRMTEATGRPAMTIAGFLKNAARFGGVPENSVLVIDEASMLDIILAYRLFAAIPSSCRVILIGDPYQLPPVGPGLTLHALVSVPAVPVAELTKVCRFGGVIAEAAKNVRGGRWLPLPEKPDSPVSFLPCSRNEVANVVLRHYLTDPIHTQILTFTRQSGPASAKALNKACQAALAGSARRLLVRNEDRDRLEDSGLRLGEPVLCTKNLWDWNIQNGSLGRIEEIEDTPQPLFSAEGQPAGIALAWVRWDDGERRPVTEEVLDCIELGYAITVHKAQGSQFKRIIVPVYNSRNLDRTMFYTAITRATDQVILIGEVTVARRAVEYLPHASRRQVALAQFLEGIN